MDDSPEPIRKRLRTSHACDICRSRKIRCDGNNPCASCKVADTQCTYGSEASSRGKSDLILEGVQRVEKYLQELNANLASSAPSPVLFRGTRQSLLSPNHPSSSNRQGSSFSQWSPLPEVLQPHHHHHPPTARPPPPAPPPRQPT
ncbi:hypothetical protein NKR19_g4795, partial [Coniochaeta hoffmannii]